MNNQVINAGNSNFRMEADTISNNVISSKNQMSRRNILRYFLVATIAVVAILTSCNKDDDDDNYFMYDGKKYTLNKGYIGYYGATGGVYNFDIMLLSSGLQVDVKEGKVTGKGHMMYFELWSSSSTGLDDGKFTFSILRGVNKFTEAFAAINIDFATKEGDKLVEITGGNVDISTNDKITTLTFDLTAKDDKKVTGKFKGDLQK